MANTIYLLIILLFNPPSLSPWLNLPWLRLLCPDDLVTVEQAERIVRLLESPHGINRGHAQLMVQVVTLDDANAMLTGGSSFHLNGALDHTVDDTICSGMLAVIVEENGF